MNPKLLLAVVVAALIAAAGFQLWRGQTTDPAPTVDSHEHPTTEEGAVRPASGDLAPERVDAETEPNRVDVGTASLDSAGQGVMGRIVRPDGQPVLGAKVFLMEGLGDGSLFARMTMAKDGVHFPPVAATESDRDGVFRLGLRKSIDRKRYEVRAIHDRFAEAIVSNIQVDASEWHDVGDVAMPNGIVIRGRVTMAGTHNIPITDATVLAQAQVGISTLNRVPGREQGIRVTTDANGYFVIENASLGPTRLTAMAPGFARVEKTAAIDGRSIHEFEFELPRGKSIAGHIADATGKPIARAKIRAMSVSASPAVWSEAISDERGLFEILGLVDGPYSVKAQARGFVQAQRAPISAGVGDLQFVLHTLCAARLRVTTPAGRLVESFQATVRRYIEGQDQLSSMATVPTQRVQRRHLEDGVFTIQGIEPGTFVVELSVDGFAKTYSEPFRCDVGAAPPLVEVTMQNGGTIRGRILDANGRPLQRAEVSTLPNDAVDNPIAALLGNVVPTKITRRATNTDDRGDFALPRLAPGTYQIKIDHPEHTSTRLRGIEVANDQVVVLDAQPLQRGVAVSGTVTIDGQPKQHVKVTVVSKPDPLNPDLAAVSAEGFTDGEGRFELQRRLPAGRTYTARAARQTPGNPMVQVLDARRSEQEFVLEPGQPFLTLNFTFQSTGPIGR